MLDRPPSPAAVRNRRWRAERKAGWRKVRFPVPVRRVTAALRRSHPGASFDTWPAIEAELAAVVEAFCQQWVGPEKKPDTSRTRKR